MAITKESILKILEKESIRFIYLQFTDLLGTLKAVSVPVTEIDNILNGKVMFDGSSVQGFVRIEESDMVLVPDLSTFAILPWKDSPKKVARLICFVHRPDNEPFEGDPRRILRRAEEEASKMGFTLNAGPEMEFFLFPDGNHNKHDLLLDDTASYFDLEPLDKGEDARQSIVVTLQDMGFNIEASHHEAAPHQHEIDFRYDRAIVSADNVMTLKTVVKVIATRFGLQATFMPKPILGINGSGMHVHLSLSDKEGRNVFYDPSDEHELSIIAKQFIAGIIKHIKGITLLLNPTVNSYKRLVPHHEAPVNIAWSFSNRSPLIRVPAGRQNGTRIELRSPDPSANPYLAFAAILTAGLDGIRKNLTPPPALVDNLYEMTEEERQRNGVGSLPADLGSAIAAFKEEPLNRKLLGDFAYSNFLKAKEMEWIEYRKQVHPWEIDRYFNV
ncbi:type I glutamate--ammonia ligase [Coprothermobacter platensis]|uniref:type I glutamate--ammonia ligase n=1 Tax=Coprothermobacter platensis TaxID=108819 RepID=UPI00035E1D5F|nr:type I glutamate--ammonia ligase [Coprothermobacter platensis]